MDELLISGLKINAIIGVYPHEKTIRQDLFLDLLFYFDARPSAETDNLADTIDYDQLSREIKELLEQEPCNLIETVAEKTARICLSYAVINKVKVSVSKPSALKRAENVKVTITRS